MRRSTEQSREAAHYVEADSELAGQRLDNFLLASLKGVPRSHVYRLIRSGQVRVNSGRARPSYRLELGDRVRIPPVSQRTAARPLRQDQVSWLADRIIYEDARIMVLDKPAGLAVHGGSGINLGCIEALRSLRPGLRTLELVHRLDRGTSGCLLVAKRRSALRRLHQVLREGRMDKRYLALVKGSWQQGELDVDLALTAQRSGRGETFVKVDPQGKPARSHFRPVEGYGSRATLMEVRISTGRTHQIRVHAASFGHPVAGDERYGDPEFNVSMEKIGLRRLFLHAHSLGFVWPESDEEVAVSTPLPAELSRVLDGLQPRRKNRD